MMKSFGIIGEELPSPADNATEALCHLHLMPLLSVLPKNIAREVETNAKHDMNKRKQIGVSCLEM